MSVKRQVESAKSTVDNDYGKHRGLLNNDKNTVIDDKSRKKSSYTDYDKMRYLNGTTMIALFGKAVINSMRSKQLQHVKHAREDLHRNNRDYEIMKHAVAGGPGATPDAFGDVFRAKMNEFKDDALQKKEERLMRKLQENKEFGALIMGGTNSLQNLFRIKSMNNVATNAVGATNGQRNSELLLADDLAQSQQEMQQSMYNSTMEL